MPTKDTEMNTLPNIPPLKYMTVYFMNADVFCTRSALFSCITDVSHRFSLCCGKSITLKNNSCTTARSNGYNNAIVFSSDPLKRDEIFEVRKHNSRGDVG